MAHGCEKYKPETILLFLMNKRFYLSDDEVQSQLATKYNLLVHIGFDTLQYAIVDFVRDQVKVLAEYEIPMPASASETIKAIQSLPESSREFKYTFNKVKISYDSFDYTFVPAELYDDADQMAYTRFIGNTANSDILTTRIGAAAIRNVSAINSDLHAGLNTLFNKPILFNQADPFLEGIKRASATGKENQLFIDFGMNHFQIGCLKDSNLTFYNLFECANADEFNYFLINVIDQFGIENAGTQIVLSGKASTGDPYFQRIEKYFADITSADTTQLIKFSEKLSEVPVHQYFSILSLELCG